MLKLLAAFVLLALSISSSPATYSHDTSFIRFQPQTDRAD
jgi:hypothetical protein